MIVYATIIVIIIIIVAFTYDEKCFIKILYGPQQPGLEPTYYLNFFLPSLTVVLAVYFILRPL